MDELPGHIGPYEVRDRLGHGGMGVVYLGFDPMLDRPVAIKVLKVPDEETRRRFLREARLAARVHHPHIVSIYAVGEHEGNPYLAMEFIAGRTMAQIIRGGEQVPLARKVHWLSELCAGLGHAHESGIVHRDVKPSNLLIAQGSGMLRLLDFGIAHGNEASSMTMAGMIVGTPQYMSPEQITGQAVDARSDIFSVGVVAYELLTGQQAFGGDNLYNVSRQIVGEQPRPIESFVPDVPNVLVKTIAKCLQKEPGARAGNAKLLEREFLSIARRLDPEHTLVVLASEPTIVTPQAKDVTTSRKEWMREAEEAIEQGELTTASGLLHKLESGTSPNPDVQQLRQKLQARRLALRLQEAIARADEATQTGSLEEAEAAINALADLSPRHPALERLRKAHQERIDERQVSSLMSRARLALQQDRLDEAESLLAEALSLAPDAADALGLQEKLSARTRAQRIARLVAQASRALDQEDEIGARRAIEALNRIDPAHRDVARLQTRLAALALEVGEASGTRTGLLSPLSSGPVVIQPPGPAPAATPPAAAPPAPPVVRPPAAAPAAAAPGAAAAGATAAAAAARSAASPSSTPAPGTAKAEPAPPPKPAAAPVTAKPAPAAPAASAKAVDAGHAPPAPAPAAKAKPGTPPAAKPASPGSSSADGLLLRDPSAAGAHAEVLRTAPAMAGGAEKTTPERSPAMLAGVAAVVLLLVGGGLYYQFGRSGPDAPSTTTTGDVTPPPASGTPPAAGTTAAKDGPVPAGETASSTPPTATPASTTDVAAAPAGSRTDPWAAVHQFSKDGKYDRAISAIDQVKGVPAALMQEERGRVVENARRYALAARRGAEDLRLTKSPQYIEGTAKQEQADKDRDAGKFKQAVSGYTAARGHYLQSFSDSGKAAPPVVAEAPPVAETPPATPPAPPATAAESNKAESNKAESTKSDSPDVSNWSNEEARAVVGRFEGAYVGRDLGGLRRLWPNMEPNWSKELTDAFATSGTLVCMFEDLKIVRTSDQFIVTARLLTQLPGEEQRRRNLYITLVPARDRLVIQNLRVR